MGVVEVPAYELTTYKHFRVPWAKTFFPPASRFDEVYFTELEEALDAVWAYNRMWLRLQAIIYKANPCI